MNTAATRKVVCPACKGPSLFDPGNPWRPFCSELRRQADLGAWASERFRMPAAPPTDEAEPGAPAH